MNLTVMRFERLCRVNFYSSLKENAGNVMFMSKQSTVFGKPSKTLVLDNWDVEDISVTQVLMFLFN